MIFLSFEKHKYVLEQICPLVLGENAPNVELMAYANWLDLNEISHCYMMNSMNSVLLKQHEGYKNAREIIYNVEYMFRGQSLLVRQAAV